MKTNFFNWLSFKQQLTEHADKHLLFRYSGDKMVHASYHITEIKQAPVTSVDCGGKLNSWTEIVIQLWEPGINNNQQRAMKVEKAISIIELVARKMFVDPQAIVKIEFGNSQFDTRQMYPDEFLIEEGDLVITLVPGFTQCKATSRGQICGTNDDCSTPAKQEIKIPDAELSACCTPGGGCC